MQTWWIMNKKKRLTERNDRVKMAAVSRKKNFLKGSKWGKSLFVAEHTNWKNLRWKKKIKRSKVKRGLKRYKVGKNRFQILEESELFLLNALLSNLWYLVLALNMYWYESRTYYQFFSSGSKQHVSVNIRNSST